MLIPCCDLGSSASVVWSVTKVKTKVLLWSLCVPPELHRPSDTLLNVFLAIAVDNLANAQELTKVGSVTRFYIYKYITLILNHQSE